VRYCLAQGGTSAGDLDAWFSPPEAHMIRESPRMHVVDRSFQASVCDWLIERARGRLSRATIDDKATGGTTEHGRRTNSQCDLDLEVGARLHSYCAGASLP
jgi:hypothetical protein